MYPYPKTASMVTMVAMVGNSVGKSAKKSVAKFWSTSWSLQTLRFINYMDIQLITHRHPQQFRKSLNLTFSIVVSPLRILPCQAEREFCVQYRPAREEERVEGELNILLTCVGEQREAGQEHTLSLS